jgi:hypothetical protein
VQQRVIVIQQRGGRRPGVVLLGVVVLRVRRFVPGQGLASRRQWRRSAANNRGWGEHLHGLLPSPFPCTPTNRDMTTAGAPVLLNCLDYEFITIFLRG